MKRYLTVFLVIAGAVAFSAPEVAQTAPNPPTGVTAFAQDGKVSLAWQAVSGATGYKVYRGTSAGSITTVVGSPTTTSFTDTTTTNGTTYYYAVSATGAGESAKSATTSSKPVARSCSTGNAIVLENCYPGNSGWMASAAGPVGSSSSNIEGFATASSINAGDSIGIKVNTADNAPYHIDIYRMGYYGGTHGRLLSSFTGLRGVRQDACVEGSGNTGLVDCSNWSTSATITTTSSWVTGVYMLRLVRDDTGTDNNVLFIVRSDGNTSDVVYQVPTATYQAYNNYGGKSLYDFNSTGANTVAATPRAVKVSYDRPYSEPYTTDPNWFPYQDVASVGFLERNGYDLSYITSTDLHTSTGAQIAVHKAFVSPTHDEYWSAEMRSAVTSARNSGTGLLFLGSNEVYWKIRYETNPFSGGANRVEVCYKTTQSGVTDPVSPTGTWRDPAGANQPENALAGQMYIGDNGQASFPLQVTAAQGKNRVWRHTSLANLAAGTTASIGQRLVGWEWDARVSNGLEPAGLQQWSASAVTGELVQHNGRDYLANGTATANSTIYQASSGAYVVSTGTNNWTRGLDTDGLNSGEVNADLQQATVNMLVDMRARPTKPMAGLTVDTANPPNLTDRNPAVNGTGVPTDSDVTATFDTSLDPASATTQNFTLTTQAGSAVSAAVSYDDSTRTITLNPTNPLGANAVYTAKLKGGVGGIAGWGGALAQDITWSFTTGSGTPPTVLSTVPANGATDVATGASVKATFDRDMLASSITTSSFTLTPQAGTAVAATVSYDAATDTATLTPSAALDASRQYTATLTTAVKGGDGTALASSKSWTFTTADPLAVTNRVPAPLSTGVSPGALVRAVFSRAVDATTLTTSTFTLTPPSGSAVNATVSYDATTRTATLTPSASLALNTTYTAKVTTGVHAADGSALPADVTWTFTTAVTAPAGPSVIATSPTDGATGVAVGSAVTATFDRALDPTSVTGQSFLVRDSSNAVVASTVTYDSASQTATLRPVATLAPGATFTAQLTTAIRSSTGAPMGSAVSWTFTTADCPCSLMPNLTPVLTNMDVRDGRSGTGPFTYEMGTKITVDKQMKLTAIRFYKDPGETGTHVGRVWSSAGTQLASVTFANESASGWQKATLSSPLTLSANTTYTVSVGLNTRFVMTEGGLTSQLTNGPLHSVNDGANGVFGNAAGTFPNQSWHSSNYFVDAVVANPGSVNTPQLAARAPVSGATEVDPGTTVTATFASDLDPATVNTSTFQLLTAAGNAVAATVTWNNATDTATLTPTNGLALGATYTAKLTTGIHSDDGTALPSAITWSFSTATSVPPSVISTSPAAGATNVGVTQPVQATFSVSLDPTTINGSTFTLSSSAGSVPATVTYDDATKTATLNPSSSLTSNTSYTATISTGVKGTTGKPMSAPKTWSFTTSTCPCMMMASAPAPQYTGLDVRDGRPAPGPWSYELGTKFQVSSPVSLTAIRFYKDAAETGTHVGTLWNASGQVVAQVTFSGESASGWQQQALTTPVSLTAGVTYTVSVGFNARFVTTPYGLRTALTSGPLSSVADGSNGVYGLSAGVFPTGSWSSSNYYVDAVVR